MAGVPTVALNNGVEMPQLGLGSWQVGEEAVAAALEVGYRSVDTATIYRNEADVGRAIAASGIPREELFVTTKVWEADQGFDSTLRAFEESRERLGLEVVDLYLIHWPAPAEDRYVDTWRALEQLHANGDVRAIGVSNFQPDQLDRLARETGTVPAVNQIELHPRLPQRELRDYHRGHGIATEAYSPLDQASSVLREPVVTELAERYERTPAQIVLRWSIELGNVVIPRSSNRRRIEENLHVFDFELDSAGVEAIGALASDPA
jgi:diketogulonate reductase-like aldo/keto reductase